ncbi:MAG UNVERIFIED_CONTAM: hypothetical protein LVT10_00330 [Anaerolineae bacterium]
MIRNLNRLTEGVNTTLSLDQPREPRATDAMVARDALDHPHDMFWLSRYH